MTETISTKTLAYIATVDDLIRPFADRLVVGLAGISKGRAAVTPPGVARTLLLVKSLRIIVLLPLGFLTRASTVVSLYFFVFLLKEKDTLSTSVLIL